ncbi:SDR family NAD(P)-dependent oxidoreductase [Streptomyces kronopolitis]|uniref:SDR family NAD(P)-dependent oxidoreductase n=1 Tax=Streptomyces kronopolitis TaxID=1612435 RepID=UPI003683E8A3
MPTVLITGATSGIGAEFARSYADKGANLVLVARNRERLNDTAHELRRSFGVTVEVLAADLLEASGCQQVEDRLNQNEAPVDILINNAGFGLSAPFPHSSIDDEERMLDILVRVPLRLAYSAIPGMTARGRGAIVNVASVAALLPTGTYGAAKAWLTAFSESLRVDLAPSGVRVLAICPGFTRTEFHERAGMDMSAIPSWIWLDAGQVVGQAMKDLARRRPLSIAGWWYKAYAQAVRHAPRVLAATMARSRTPRD